MCGLHTTFQELTSAPKVTSPQDAQPPRARKRPDWVLRDVTFTLEPGQTSQ